MQLLREVGVNTRHEPNGWHYGAVSMACLKAGDEDGALSVQSEWRDKQVCSINRVYLPNQKAMCGCLSNQHKSGEIARTPNRSAAAWQCCSITI